MVSDLGKQTMDKLLQSVPMTLYCVKCRKKQPCRAEELTMKNGKPAWRGKCPVCQTAMFKIGERGTAGFAGFNKI